jgi:hypothetical protein
MTLDLEQHLKELCEQHRPNLDLCERLERVRNSAEAIWQEQRLKWFTDHRAATHSRYIIEHLGSVLEHLQSTPQHLTPHELYVLLAACYLHDIGMQDFQSHNGHSVDQFTDEDYKRIRKNHPQRAADLIIARTLRWERDEFKIDLDPDPQYLVPIALVSQGHGSAFFPQTVEELQGLANRPGNMPFRGELLAALLLMGDELDLHERRATFPPEFSQSPVSLLHNHIHHYVTGVEVIDGRTPKHCRIRLIMEYPQDSDEYRPLVRQWLVTKLHKQCELTRPILESCTQGELSWDDQIEIPPEGVDRYGVRRSLLDPDHGNPALNELRHELLDGQTVDREELREVLQGALAQCGQHFQAIEIIDQERSDWSHLTKWLKAACDCGRVILIHIAFQQAVGHGSLDVLRRLFDKLTGMGLSCPNYGQQISFTPERQDALDMQGQAMLTDLATCADQHPMILLLERVDEAEQETRLWIENWLLPELSKQNVKMLAVSTRFNGNGQNTPDYLQRLWLVPFTHDQIAVHLNSEFGLPPEQAKHEADSILGQSFGSPLGVLNGLSHRRQRNMRLL